MYKLSDTVERKFVESYENDEYEVLSDSGFVPITHFNKTVPYEKYIVYFNDGSSLECADTHILIDTNGNEVFAKDSLGRRCKGNNSELEVISVETTGILEDMYDLSVNSIDHTYYTNNVLSHNSVTSIVWLLWHAIFNAEKTIAILANKRATANEMLSRITLALENLPFFLQPGCKVLNKGSIVFSNNTKIFSAATTSSSVRGQSCNVIFLDEFAFVQNAHEFYTSTYPVISSGKDTRVIITSTPNGIGNLFHQLWEAAVQNRSSYKPLKVNWWDVPGRDEAWMRETIANTSQRKFDQEFSVRFLGSSTTLVDPDALFAIKATEPVAVRRNGNFKAFKTPTEQHSYVMTVDVAQGRGQDYSTFTIFDTSVMPYEQVATFRDNMISPMMFPDVIVRFAKEYNEALVIIENNDAGKVVCNGVYYEHEYENTFTQSSTKANGIGVTMSKLVKRVGCSNLKDLVELGKLALHDAESISELSAFEVKDNSYGGKDGVHDDLVMNLVMFAWFVSTDGFGYTSLGNLRDILYADRLKEMEDDVVPLGVMGNPSNDSYVNPAIQQAIDNAKEWRL